MSDTCSAVSKISKRKFRGVDVLVHAHPLSHGHKLCPTSLFRTGSVSTRMNEPRLREMELTFTVNHERT